VLITPARSYGANVLTAARRHTPWGGVGLLRDVAALVVAYSAPNEGREDFGFGEPEDAIRAAADAVALTSSNARGSAGDEWAPV
jgi:hypothetical protein